MKKCPKSHKSSLLSQYKLHVDTPGRLSPAAPKYRGELERNRLVFLERDSVQLRMLYPFYVNSHEESHYDPLRGLIHTNSPGGNFHIHSSSWIDFSRKSFSDRILLESGFFRFETGKDDRVIEAEEAGFFLFKEERKKKSGKLIKEIKCGTNLRLFSVFPFLRVFSGF
ncbi:hypothetical protein AVEN_234280-1 [Araneus ventricosus]|uniref:Uncharacterized protein n=1 Tax=Araneus ventricosus TaxID=182803 RepID=A0A4Y2A9C9_ARAVE|nr:hypothetical protein AVEN_234280-1 [Araneus ventricosus]